MKGIILILLISALIVIAGCIGGEDKITSKTVEETKETTTKETVSTKLTSCGDGKCVDAERCDYTTYQTVCPEDCPISCPPKIVVSEPECVGECTTAETGFAVTGDAKIKIRLENIGERATDTAKTRFRCFEGETLVIQNDNERKYDVVFMDYFDSYVEGKSINSRITGAGNVVNYFLEFDFGDLTRNADLRCSISIDDGTIYLGVRESVDVNLRKL